jgi:hypothetical protein
MPGAITMRISNDSPYARVQALVGLAACQD